jgi:membrane dipeptidase
LLQVAHNDKLRLLFNNLSVLHNARILQILAPVTILDEQNISNNTHIMAMNAPAPLRLLLLPVLLACGKPHEAEKTLLGDEELRSLANKLAKEIIIIDTHVDVPYRLTDKMEDLSVRTAGGDFDYPRAKAGGLNVPFMSIYVPARYESGGAKDFADRLIAMVEKFAADWPDKFAVATSVADVKTQFASGRVSLAMGMENGSPIEGKLENIRYFHDRGIRYITLAHSKTNHICDSSFDKERRWNGLSPFGRSVVAEMNRVGIMVDVSHISDSAFYQVLAISKAPVIASHSSCRSFTPGWERNMSDEMIMALAANGGVIHINFGSAFLRADHAQALEAQRTESAKYLEEHKLKEPDEGARAYMKRYREEHPAPLADVTDVVAHIEHVIELVGVDHVGFGSDFDGVGDTLPTGLKDVSYYPNLIYQLLKKGYSEQDIRKMCSGNTLRVWSQVESIALQLQHN